MIDQIHFVTINGKEYPFAYSDSVVTHASAMPQAQNSLLMFSSCVIYCGIRKACRKQNIRFPFEGDEGFDNLIDLVGADTRNGGNAKATLEKIIEEANLFGEADELDSKKNSPLTKSNGTPSNTVQSKNTSNQNQEPLAMPFTPGEIVT